MLRYLENVHKKKQNFLQYFKNRRTKPPPPKKKNCSFFYRNQYQSWGEEGRQYTGTDIGEAKFCSHGLCSDFWSVTQRVKSFQRENRFSLALEGGGGAQNFPKIFSSLLAISQQLSTVPTCFRTNKLRKPETGNGNTVFRHLLLYFILMYCY